MTDPAHQSLTLDEVQKMRLEVERQIASTITRFHSLTGLVVTDVSLSNTWASLITEPADKLEGIAIKIDVQLPDVS